MADYDVSPVPPPPAGPPPPAPAPPQATGTVTEVRVQGRRGHLQDGGATVWEVTVSFHGTPDPGVSAAAFEQRLWTAVRTKIADHVAELG